MDSIVMYVLFMVVLAIFGIYSLAIFARRQEEGDVWGGNRKAGIVFLELGLAIFGALSLLWSTGMLFILIIRLFTVMLHYFNFI